MAHFDYPNYYEMLAVMSDAGVLESRNRAYLTETNEPVYGPDFKKKTAFFNDPSR
ncbi:hypothetical protein OAN12_01220 [Halioglobus sp.]|nr:hypothetical protein [Halioglobus sp.]